MNYESSPKAHLKVNRKDVKTQKAQFQPYTS